MTEYTYQWNPEWADDPTMPLLKVTKSSLNTFEFCRKQYEFSYIEGRRSEPNAAMARGSAVHNSYEDFYNDFEIKKAEEMDENLIYEYCMGLFPIDDHSEVYQTMAAFETERFVKSRKDESLDSYLPIGNEIRCNAQLEIPQTHNTGHKPHFSLLRDYTVHLQGIIDRVFEEDVELTFSECEKCFVREHLPKGKLGRKTCNQFNTSQSGKCKGKLSLVTEKSKGFIPVELKTGVWKDRKQAHMRNEMAFYKVLMDADPDVALDPVTHWAWYYPDSNHFGLEPVIASNENRIAKRIAKLIHAYEQGIFPASYYPAKCQYCSFIGICDSAQQAELWDW